MEVWSDQRFLTWVVTQGSAYRITPGGPIQVDREPDVHGRFIWRVLANGHFWPLPGYPRVEVYASLAVALGMPKFWDDPPQEQLYHHYQQALNFYFERPATEDFDPELLREIWIK